jgi:orotate phosphoribosyltransferase
MRTIFFDKGFFMEKRAYDIFSRASGNISVRVIPGHFATKHSHISHCIDMTKVKSQMDCAKEAAKLLSANFIYNTPVDTIISLDRMKMIGAYMAEELSRAGINLRQNIAVISPEITEGKMLLRDNFLPYVNDKHVLLLTASASTGQTVHSAIEGIRYYGGDAVGVATVFRGDFECDVPVVSLFGLEDITDYLSYVPQDCPLCRKGVKVDAVVNSYGYSKIL